MKKIYYDINMDDLKSNNKDNSKRSDESNVKGVRHIVKALYETPPGSHTILVYSDIRILRMAYPAYVKSLLENDEIVVILTYYDHPSIIRQVLNGHSKKINEYNSAEGYAHDGSLVIVDSPISHSNPYSNPNQHNTINTSSGNDNLNLLSLIRILLNHGMKNKKNGITIFSDMGSFFHANYSLHENNVNDNGNVNGNNHDGINHRIHEYESSIPARYKELELKNFCLYHQKDYESRFASKHQKAQLLDFHGRSVLMLDNNNNG